MSARQSPDVQRAGSDYEPGVWQQFRRRRVVRTALLYLMLAFAVAEGTLYLAPLVGLSEVGVRVVFGAAVLGFPVTVVLAWTYDVTPHGIVRTPEEWTDERPPAPGGRYGWLLVGSAAVALGVVFRVLRT